MFLKHCVSSIQTAVIWAVILLIYVLGCLFDVMEVDAAQYASISRQMLETGQFLEIWNRDVPYLDKPPFLFWVSALSIKIFGLSSWAYKLPSVVFSLLGIFSTYSFAKLIYNERVGMLAALMLASCQAVFLMNHDVRTDNILTASIIFSVWKLYAYTLHGRWADLIWGFAGMAVSMLTKGPIGVMVPIFALGTHFVIQKQWKHIFKWQWLLGIFIIAAIILPMCIGLYRQYGSEGLYFYFWKQSFGRITGENKWRNDSTVFYFLHNLLWALLPWSILFIMAFVNRTKNMLKSGSYELITWGGFILTFVAMSLSKYKLPHYVFITFPFAAILLASWVWKLEEERNTKWINRLSFMQLFIAVLLFVASLLLMYSFPPHNVVLWYLLAGVFLWYSAVSFMRKDGLKNMLYPALYAMLFTNIVLNAHFYPALFQLQSSSVAGKIFSEKHRTGEKLYFLNIAGHALDFYGNIITRSYNGNAVEGDWIYTDSDGIERLKREGKCPKVIYKLPQYKVQFLKLKFLNPETRKETINRVYLLKL